MYVYIYENIYVYTMYIHIRTCIRIHISMHTCAYVDIFDDVSCHLMYAYNIYVYTMYISMYTRALRREYLTCIHTLRSATQRRDHASRHPMCVCVFIHICIHICKHLRIHNRYTCVYMYTFRHIHIYTRILERAAQ